MSHEQYTHLQAAQRARSIGHGHEDAEDVMDCTPVGSFGCLVAAMFGLTACACENWVSMFLVPSAYAACWGGVCAVQGYRQYRRDKAYSGDCRGLLSKSHFGSLMQSLDRKGTTYSDQILAALDAAGYLRTAPPPRERMVKLIKITGVDDVLRGIDSLSPDEVRDAGDLLRFIYAEGKRLDHLHKAARIGQAIAEHEALRHTSGLLTHEEFSCGQAVAEAVRAHALADAERLGQLVVEDAHTLAQRQAKNAADAARQRKKKQKIERINRCRAALHAAHDTRRQALAAHISDARQIEALLRTDRHLLQLQEELNVALQASQRRTVQGPQQPLKS